FARSLLFVDLKHRTETWFLLVKSLIIAQIIGSETRFQSADLSFIVARARGLFIPIKTNLLQNKFYCSFDY
ncbi:MAG TPA: hypothetical protein V6C58_12065, partial [Allocoleopsis sp.]